ncbi:MAG: accessory factor UbiK family protein [Gammaproteobacteria bacterium]
MVNKQLLDNLSKKINQLLPRAGELGEEGRVAVRQVLQKSFTELHILTQADFDARDRALKRAEERVNELEHQVQELERQLENLK